MRVFRLIAIQAIDGCKRSHGRLLSDETALGVFTSPENAEAMICIHADKVKDYARILGYILYENELDDLALHGPWEQVPEFLSVRSYFADGTLNAFCDCDNTSEKHWHGRDPKTMHYKRGDHVSVWNGDIVPALIGDTPRKTGTIDGDWTDDCYLAYSAEMGHWHPFTPYVFPLVGKLSKRTVAKIEAERSEWENPARHRTRAAKRKARA